MQGVCIAELEILADGLHLVLIDPYNEPKLKVRYPHSATYEEVRYLLSVQHHAPCVRALCPCNCGIPLLMVELHSLRSAALSYGN